MVTRNVNANTVLHRLQDAVSVFVRPHKTKYNFLASNSSLIAIFYYRRHYSFSLCNKDHSTPTNKALVK